MFGSFKCFSHYRNIGKDAIATPNINFFFCISQIQQKITVVFEKAPCAYLLLTCCDLTSSRQEETFSILSYETCYLGLNAARW